LIIKWCKLLQLTPNKVKWEIKVALLKSDMEKKAWPTRPKCKVMHKNVLGSLSAGEVIVNGVWLCLFRSSRINSPRLVIHDLKSYIVHVINTCTAYFGHISMHLHVVQQM
jgi:hypothetical protein